MTISDEVQSYLSNRPTRYEFNTYAHFLREIDKVVLPNAIHITGTNGKGSTARYLANTLTNSGYKVGLFISPHFEHFNELASINGREISDEFIYNEINTYRELFDKHTLSAFEIMTFISFMYFIKAQVDFTIVEVGMGGTNDATNIFTPILNVITNVGLDHKIELGPTLEDIARHKAGIIKHGVPVIVGKVVDSALKVISDKATKEAATLINANLDFTIKARNIKEIIFTHEEREYTLASGAQFEVINASLVIEIIKVLQNLGHKIKRTSLVKALRTPPYLGRFSVVRERPLVIVDGAHNTHALRALFNDVLTFNKKVYVVYGTFSDKEYEQSLDLLSLVNAEVILTTFNHPRALNSFNNDHGFIFSNSHQSAIKQTIAKMKANDLLLIIGSLYFATLVTKEFREGIYEI